MRKIFFEFKMLFALTILLGLASCTDNSDNPAVPDKPQEQLADYTIIYYGHGGGDLDLPITGNLAQLYAAGDESYANVNICAQFKFSTIGNMKDLYRRFLDMLNLQYTPGTPKYEEGLKILKVLESYYPYAAKTARFVVDREHAFLSEENGLLKVTDEGAFIGPDNADVTRADSLTNFINWAAKACPARKYILVLSDHGGGYLPSDEQPVTAAAARQTRGIVYDDGNYNNHFTAKTLVRAIQQASVRPTAVYLDACLMNTAEYQFELAPVTDYLALSTFSVPGEGGNYPEFINALSDNPDNPEKALEHLVMATVDHWDETAAKDGKKDSIYHDMSVYRTADIDALGAEIKLFTDKLIDAYQNGGDEVRAKIDRVTAKAYRIDRGRPLFDLIDYAVNLSIDLPDVFGDPSSSELGKAFDRCIVYQQSSRWLKENDHDVDLSVLLGCQGHYTMIDEYGTPYIFYPDGSCYEVVDGETQIFYINWESTLDETYGQLRFDQMTGWSRWLYLNQQEPNTKNYTGYNPFEEIFNSTTDL